MPAERTQPIADVARENFETDRAEHVAGPFAHGFDATESDQRLPSRFIWRHAGASVLLRLLLDVEANLVVEPVLDLLPVRHSEGSGDPPPQISERPHQALTVVTSRTRLIARDMRRHCARESFRCRRPRAVNE